jgi:hypothetical protein
MTARRSSIRSKRSNRSRRLDPRLTKKEQRPQSRKNSNFELLLCELGVSAVKEGLALLVAALHALGRAAYVNHHCLSSRTVARESFCWETPAPTLYGILVCI